MINSFILYILSSLSITIKILFYLSSLSKNITPRIAVKNNIIKHNKIYKNLNCKSIH